MSDNERWQLSLHCHSRLPAPPIVLDFNQKAGSLNTSGPAYTKFRHRVEISAILAYFCSHLVAMATPLVPLKIVIAYLNSPTQYPDFSCEKFLDFLQTTKISAILPYFCSNLVAMATPLAPLEIRIAF